MFGPPQSLVCYVPYTKMACFGFIGGEDISSPIRVVNSVPFSHIVILKTSNDEPWSGKYRYEF